MAMMSIIGLTATALGTYSSIVNANAQAAQQAAAYQAQAQLSEYNAKIAEQNAKLSEEQASAERRQGYEEMESIRLKGAKAIGAQRAAAGASGAVVDIGSNLDLQLDTAQLSEIDAINAYNTGIDNAYNYEVQAWNARSQAANYRAQAGSYESAASSARSTGRYNAWNAALGGIASLGSTWGSATNWWNY